MGSPSETALTRPSGAPGRGDHVAATGIRRGETIGRYVVLDRLGAGGMGVVFAAYDPKLDRKVALKLLHPSERGTGGPAAQRLVREAQAMAKLVHPNVITVHDVGTHARAVFVAMEFVHGSTLRQWITQTRATPLSVAAILDAVVQAGRGLQAAHERGLVHRDFKPDNVMVADDGRVRVMDFGLVRALEGALGSKPDANLEVGRALDLEDALDSRGGAGAAMERVRAKMARAGRLEAARPSGQSGRATDASQAPDLDATPLAAALTRTGACLGTPAYMSPEQARGELACARSDQFSFAVAAWEALLGEHPFGGHTAVEVMTAIIEGRVRPPPTVEGMPPWVVPALTRALAAESSDRHPSMGTLLAALCPPPRGPGRAWARIGGVGVAASAVALTVGLRLRTPPCTGARARLESHWSPARRTAVATALRSTGLAFADPTARHVDDALDAYAQRWVVAATDACEATLVQREQSEAVLDRRIACLDRRLAEFDALVAILADPEPGASAEPRMSAEIAVSATEAIAHLPAIAPCADRAALARTVDPPSDGASLAALARAGETLARASAAYRTGQWDTATARVTQAQAEALRLGYRPLLAEVALVSGQIFAALGDTESAIERLTAAAWDGRASGHLEVAAQAEARLAFVVGLSAGRPDEGLAWSRHAAAEVDRLGAERPVRAELLNNRAVLMQLSGDSDGALQAFTAALHLRQRLLGEQHPDTAESRFNLGVLHRKTGAYARAREQHRRALKIRRNVFGPEHPKVADSLMALGAVASRLGESARAKARYTEALALQQAALGDDHVATARTHEALGTLAASAREFDEARTHFAAALAVYRARLSADDPRLGRAWMNQGAFELDAGNPAQAEVHLQAAVAQFERVGGPAQRDLGWALASLGLAYSRRGARETAIAALTRATTLLDKTSAEPLLRGSVWADLARASSDRDPAGAAEAARTARALLDSAGPAGADRLAELERWQAGVGAPEPATDRAAAGATASP